MTLLYFFAAFALTVLIESAVLLAIERKWTHLYPLFLCNLLTNPLLNALLVGAVTLFGRNAYTAAVTMLELGALVTETLLMKRMCGYGLQRSFCTCLACNGISYVMGAALWSIMA